MTNALQALCALTIVLFENHAILVYHHFQFDVMKTDNTSPFSGLVGPCCLHSKLQHDRCMYSMRTTYIVHATKWLIGFIAENGTKVQSSCIPVSKEHATLQNSFSPTRDDVLQKQASIQMPMYNAIDNIGNTHGVIICRLCNNSRGLPSYPGFRLLSQTLKSWFNAPHWLWSKLPGLCQTRLWKRPAYRIVSVTELQYDWMSANAHQFRYC